ncbi:MAG TPA: hypothetical protein VJS69_08075 [Candidatus Krumholzibacteria bacterium]|nr:hypothetical protein [Candidatus Krumholzibacteria bacterium]
MSHKIHFNLRKARFVVAIGLLFAVSSCGGPASVKQASAPPCETRVPAVHPADTLTVVVSDEIDFSHAPWPQNRAEQFVFGHLYETLVTVDCHNIVQPRIAKSWKKASDGWYIEIDEDAHFWDDKPVTAYDVKESFGPAPMFPVDTVDETHLIVHGQLDIPDIRFLALPMFAIVKRPRGNGRMIGTGPWELVADNSRADEVAIHPTAIALPVIRFMHAAPAEAMNLVAGQADAMITDDPAVIDYAQGRRQNAVVPLAWDNTYVLLSRQRCARMLGVDGQALPVISAATCDALARDAVTIDARGGSALLTEGDPHGCGAWAIDPALFGDRTPPKAVVMFATEDLTSRELAERIVALAAMDTMKSADARNIRRAIPDAVPGMRAVPVSADELAVSAERFEGKEAIYILCVSRDRTFPCVANYFSKQVPWIRSRFSEVALPLIETRAHFIAMSDRISYVDDGHGTLRIMLPGVERVR